MMKQLLKQVEQLAGDEYSRAAEQFGPTNNSRHESYAVCREEYEEATEAGDRFKSRFDAFWAATRENKSTPDLLLDMKDSAMQAAAEWIQVAAMCEKATRTEAQRYAGK